LFSIINREFIVDVKRRYFAFVQYNKPLFVILSHAKNPILSRK